MAGGERKKLNPCDCDSPPYGLKEYTDIEKAKLRNGRGGVWRIPPSFDGCKRSPVPRFTILDDTDIATLCSFFTKFAKQAVRVLVPGGHVMIATNPLLSQYVYMSFIAAGADVAWWRSSQKRA